MNERRNPTLYADNRFFSSSFSTHPIREDVKKKILPPPLRGQVDVVTYIQPHLILRLIFIRRGVVGLSALDRRAFQRRCQPQLLVPT